MRRRQVLALACGVPALSVAPGCLGESIASHTGTEANGSSATPGRTTPRQTTSRGTSTPETRIQGGTARRATLVSTDAGPDFEMLFDVEITHAATATDWPITLDITVTNDGPKRGLRPGVDGCAPFNRGSGYSSPDGVVLLRDVVALRAETDGNLWRRPEPQNAYLAYGCALGEYEAGESVTASYQLWDDAHGDATAYMPPGEYRFETIVSDLPNDEIETVQRWGFSLRIEAV